MLVKDENGEYRRCYLCNKLIDEYATERTNSGIKYICMECRNMKIQSKNNIIKYKY